MTKILVNLKDEQHSKLNQYRVDSGQPMVESIRKGVDMFLKSKEYLENTVKGEK